MLIQGQGGGFVSAKVMNFESVQDHFVSKTLDAGVHASTMGSSAGANFQKAKQEEFQTKQKAGIQLRSGKILANDIYVQNGSKIEAGSLLRQDGQEGLPTVSGTDAIDSQTNKSKGFSIEVQPAQGMNGKPNIGAECSSDKTQTVQRATVIASNVTPGVLPSINTEASKETEVIHEKRRAAAVTGTVPLKKTEEAGNKALHFLFTPSNNDPKPTNQVQSDTVSQTYSSNISKPRRRSRV